MGPQVNYDAEGEVINGPLTYQAIAQHLGHGSALIGWTDGDGTHFDIMFTLTPSFAGTIQGGLRAFGYLYVSIMRVGAFGFRTDKLDTEAGYYNEKLFHGREGIMTTEKLAELVNGIKAELNR